MAESGTKVVRWGVLGTARIATKIAAAIRRVPGAELRAVASRSADRAAAWASEHGAAESFGAYDAVVDHPGVDAVYIPLPPSMHREWTVRAAERGKHILCEKPLAMNAAEAREMADACRSCGVQLMDGVMWLHHPRAADMLRPLRDGTLGELRRVTSAFTFFADRLAPDDLRFQRALGGGSLLDLGWYCVGAALWAFGGLPERVHGTGRFRDDVDTNFSGLMWFGGDRAASFDCGFDVSARKWIEVAGTLGSLVCDDFTRPWNEEKPRFWLHGSGGKASEHVAAPRTQEVAMIERFCGIVRGGRIDEDWPSAAVRTQRVCDALAASARAGAVVELTP